MNICEKWGRSSAELAATLCGLFAFLEALTVLASTADPTLIPNKPNTSPGILKDNGSLTPSIKRPQNTPDTNERIRIDHSTS
jgi:hypothetical protein